MSHLLFSDNMKNIFFILFMSFGALSAQGTFRIFDAQMNDVTSGVIYLVDTNSAQMQVSLTVENTDSVPHNVTAGRLVISQPSGASNAFIWGMTQYPPSVDSSGIAEYMNPTATAAFEGYYFPNNNGGIATINYCFWETTDMNNNSCVTVTYDNYFPAGVGAPLESGAPIVTYGPNPASTFLGIGWSHGTFDRIELYGCDGSLVSVAKSETGFYSYEFDLTEIATGIYFIRCSNSTDPFSINFTFVHAGE